MSEVAVRSFPDRIISAISVGIIALGVIAFSPCFSVAQGQPDAPRKVVTQVAPTYPELASKLQMRGTVRLAAVVAPNGKVKSTQILGGSPVLARAAVDAVEKWRWVAAPQETTEIIELNFHP
jgi:TonB family protein